MMKYACPFSNMDGEVLDYETQLALSPVGDRTEDYFNEYSYGNYGEYSAADGNDDEFWTNGPARTDLDFTSTSSSEEFYPMDGNMDEFYSGAGGLKGMFQRMRKNSQQRRAQRQKRRNMRQQRRNTRAKSKATARVQRTNAKVQQAKSQRDMARNLGNDNTDAILNQSMRDLSLDEPGSAGFRLSTGAMIGIGVGVLVLGAVVVYAIKKSKT